MALIELLVLAALAIPVIAILIDSPLGRAFARRVEGPQAVPPQLADLAKKVEVLESEVDDLGRTVDRLKEENQFLQKLIEEHPTRRSLSPPEPPPGSPS